MDCLENCAIHPFNYYVFCLTGIFQLIFAVSWPGDTIGLSLGVISAALGLVLAASFIRSASKRVPQGLSSGERRTPPLETSELDFVSAFRVQIY